jgi:hypothetical protein
VEGLSNGFGRAVDVTGSEKYDEGLARNDCVDLDGVWEFFFVSLIERYREGRARHYCDESAGVRVPGVFCFLVFAVEVIDFDSSIAKIDRLSKKSLSLFLCHW